MYHDEFPKAMTRPTSRVDDAGPCLTLEVGGGLSLGLAASLNQPVSMLLFYLGGLLPLVTCCLSIASSRVVERLAGLAPSMELRRPWAVPTPHLATSSSRVAGRRLHRQTTRSGR